MLDRTQTVADRIANALQRHGVSFAFGQSVPSAVILACEARGIRQITYRQENMGGAMADGFARISGRIPVIFCQNGPAAAIMVAPFAEAMKAGSPIVALIQDVERAHIGKNAFQEYDHQSLFAPVTKWFRRLEDPDQIDDLIDAAFVAAGTGRPGPAVLMLPLDLQRAKASGRLRRSLRLDAWPIDRPRPPQSLIVQAAELIASAENPVIVAGGGVHASQASAVLARLQEEASLPVVTTNMGKGAVAETHPLSAGPLGALNGPGSLGRHTRPFLDEADVILLVGTRTNEDGTDAWTLIPRQARLIHIDIDPEEIGRNYEAMRLLGDARETLAALAETTFACDLAKRRAARAKLERRIADAWAAFDVDRAKEARSDAAPIRPERIMTALQAHLDDDTIVVADASYASNWVVGYLRTASPQTRIITPRGLAGLGWGFPLAIGAKLARPQAKVVAVVGDGGFGHAWAELEAAVRTGLALTVVVLNNAVLGYQKDAEQVKFGRYTSSGHLGRVDHAAIARACGGRGEVIETVADLDVALDAALGAQAVTLLDVNTDACAHPPVSLYAGKLDHATAQGIIHEAVP
ncbi:acetolactate synthase catalytic subunit [Bradyrhizobium sp. ARR65]|uniref:acetolactate synthase catalytic subunit n=1 Tax=Bradyrhizobium sp. ARR65 TaxID=1040989 RepID=UPI00046388D8|nr:acetolactate synthase catalytic subunit [Bradyrhizobium sp. ARR65]